MPGTSCWTRRKLAKTHAPLSVGEDQGLTTEDLGWGSTPLDGNEKAPHRRSGALVRSRGFLRRHMPNVDGPRVNSAVLAALLVIGLACWGALDVAQRDSKPALKPGEPPHSTPSWIGWGTALAGTVLYSACVPLCSCHVCRLTRPFGRPSRLSSPRPDPQDCARQGHGKHERVDVWVASRAELHDADSACFTLCPRLVWHRKPLTNWGGAVHLDGFAHARRDVRPGTLHHQHSTRSHARPRRASSHRPTRTQALVQLLTFPIPLATLSRHGHAS